MTGVIATIPKFSFSANGVPMVLGTLTVYLAGTTTPTDTWQDAALTTLNTNPVVLDARGECVLWLDSTKSYKFILKNASGVVQWTQDNIKTVADMANTLRTDLASSSGSSLVGFLQSGTGAVATTTQSKFRESVSVKDFGAKGDGVTDDTASIQAAWNAVKTAGGGCILAPAGTYLISSAINITGANNVEFIGAGPDATIIKSNSTTADVFYDSGTSLWRTFRDFSIASSVTRTAGSYFNLAAEKRGMFDRLHLTGHFNGMRFAGFEITEVRSCVITAPSGAGTAIIAATPGSAGQGANLTLWGCTLRGGDDITQTNFVGLYGLAIYDCDAVFAVNCDIGGFLTNDLLVNPNTRSANHFFTQCWLDATQNSDCIQLKGAGTKQQISFVGGWVASAGKLQAGGNIEACGVRAYNEGTYQDVSFTGVKFYNNNGTGFLMETPGADFNVTGCNFLSNGSAATTNKYGLWLAPQSGATTGPNITGCRFASNIGAGIRVEVNAARFSISGNNITDGVSTAALGALATWASNFDSVSSTIASAARLTIPPTLNQIFVSGTANVSGIDATYPGHIVQFTTTGALVWINNSQNLRLAGNFSAAADQTITLCCNNAGEWREVSRALVV